MSETQTLYVIARDGLESRPVKRRRLSRGDAPGVWWCPMPGCDRSQQESVKVCACGARLTDAPLDPKAEALARVAAAEQAYRDALSYASSIGALAPDETVAAQTVVVSDSAAATEAVTVPVVLPAPARYTKAPKGKRR